MKLLERKLFDNFNHLKENPIIISVIIRWKNDGVFQTDYVTVGDEPVDERIDELTVFHFNSLSEMATCCSPFEFDQSDFDDFDEWKRQVELYTESQEDLDYYFPSLEDFDIVEVSPIY